MRRWLSRKILQWWGWKVEGSYPYHEKKNIVIPIPHTSNWDFPIGILLRNAYDFKIGFVAKSTLFRFPLGGLMKWLGGIPVNRKKSANFVDSVVEAYDEREEMSVCIAPEGTRRRVDKLKTGFYYIALGANIPIVMIRWDWGQKTLTWSEPFYPTGDKEADFDVIYKFFEGAVGKIPENSFRYQAPKLTDKRHS